MPGCGGGWAVAAEPVPAGAALGAAAGGVGCTAAGGGAAGAAAAPTVTNGVILSMVLAETPALDRSATDEYGRPAMIFFAVALPTPGSASRSFSVALLMSTLAPAAGAAFSAWPAGGVASCFLRAPAGDATRTSAKTMSAAPPS